MPGQHGAGCGCVPEDQGAASGYWLYSSIDHPAIASSGASPAGSASRLFRPYDQRLDDTIVCQSEDLADPEIIICVSLTSPSKLTALTVITGEGFHAPSVRLFANAPACDFSIVHDREPTQDINLVPDFHGSIEYPLRTSKFSQLQNLTLHFPAEEAVHLHWIGLKGVASGDKRQAVVTVYEAKPNLADHAVKGETSAPRFDVA